MSFLLRLSLVPLFSAVVFAQPMADRGTDYRRFLTPPRTTQEYWDAMLFEMEVGRFDLAAGHLREMMNKKPMPDELVKLHEKEGIGTFLKLLSVPKWYDDRDKETQTRKDVQNLIDLITDAVRTRLSDPARIGVYIRNLYESPEEAGFARIELAKSGTAVVPLMITELLKRNEADRGPILNTLSILGYDTVRPLLAALDIPDDILRENILDVIRKRRDLFFLRAKGIDVAPALWPLASTLNKKDAMKTKAREILRIVYDLKHVDHLPLPLVALTEEAEQYYHHRVRFADPRRVVLWRWDGKKLFEDSTFTATKAEEYLGLRYAKLALQLDATYRPAQLVMLGLLVEKGIQAPTPERPLGTLRPTVEDLLLTLNPDLLNAALEQGLRDEKRDVILWTIKALGKLGDARALTPQTQGEPALVRALHYGDRRIQMAALDAILRIPGSASTQTTSRIVEILRQALGQDFAAADKPRILIATSRESFALDTARAVEISGFEPVAVLGGKEAVKRLQSKADIDAVLLDASIRNLDMAWVLAQLRTDRTLRRLPVLVAAVPDRAAIRDLLEEMRTLQLKAGTLDEAIRHRLEERATIEKVSSYRFARLGPDIVLDDQKRRRVLVQDQINHLSERYELEAMNREEQLNKQFEKMKHVWVVPSNQLIDARQLAVRLDERIRDSGMLPLAPTERKEYVELALNWLAKMATGEIKGFEVRPAEDAVVGMLTAPGVSDAALLNAIRILGRLPGIGAQRHLIGVFLDDKRPAPIRVAAADELLRHMQEFGKPGLQQQRILLDAALVASKQAGIDPSLRDRMTRMVGVLRPGEKTTGHRLKDFVP